MNNLVNNDDEKYLQIKLETRLKNLGIWYHFIKKPNSTVHTFEASAITGIELHRISKNLVAKTNDGKFIALIIPGDMRVDYKEVAKVMGVKNIRLVQFEDAHTISGYPPGGTPSIGYEKGIEVIIDEELLIYDTFYCGGGSTSFLLELKCDDVIKINKAKIAKIAHY